MGSHLPSPLRVWSRSSAASSMQGGKRRLDAPTLVVGYQAGEHVAEMAVAGTRVDVLPAVGFEESCLDRRCFVRAYGTSAGRREIARICHGLRLHKAVDGANQLDEFADGLIRSEERRVGKECRC